MNKRFLSLYLIVSFVFAMCVAPQAYSAEAISALDSSKSELVCNLGIMENEKAQENYVSRGEMASIINRILSYANNSKQGLDFVEWKNSFYGEVSSELKEAPVLVNSQYLDVPKNNPYYDAIVNVASLGIMKGISENSFAPDTEITYMQTVKIMVDLLGYSKKATTYGGYPQGYIRLASELGLHAKYLNSDKIKGNEIAALISDSLETPLWQQESIWVDEKGDIIKSSYSSQKSETILSKMLCLKKLKGIITDNGVTSLTGKSVLGKWDVQVGDYILHINDSVNDIRNFLGREIECYYKNEKYNDEYTIVFAQQTNRNKQITFDIDEFQSIEKNSITYRNNDKTEITKLATGYHVILNGLAISTIHDNIFQYESGSVTIVNAGGSEYHLILIEGYESFYVSAVDMQKKVLYNKLKRSGESNTSISLDEAGTDRIVTILDENGKPSDFSKITTGCTIDVAQNDTVIKIMITKKSIDNFKIVSSSDTDDGIEISNGKESYVISTYFLTSDQAFSYKVGQTYKIYLNHFGYIVWLEAVDGGLWNTGILYDIIKKTGIENNIKVKLFGTGSEFEIYELSDKIQLNDTDGSERTITDTVAYDEIKNYSGLLRYTINQDKEINKVELALDYGMVPNKPDRLYTIFYTIETDDTTNIHNKGKYMHNGQTFGGKGFLNKNTTVFFVPKDKTNESSYKIGSYTTFKNQDMEVWTSYGVDSDSVVAKYFVAKKDLSTFITYTSPMLIVSKITSVSDENGDQCYNINGIQSNKEVNLLCPYSSGVFEKAGNPMRENNVHYDISPGDILRVTTDSDGYIDYIEVVFKANAPNQLYPSAGKGWLTGTIGYLDSASTTYNNNPYTVTDAGKLIKNISYGQQDGTKIIYGYVYKSKDNVITVTTQNLQVNEFDVNNGGGRYVTENYYLDDWTVGNAMMEVNYDETNFKARSAQPQTIKTYKEYGADCSRVIITANYGLVKRCVIINGYID